MTKKRDNKGRYIPDGISNMDKVKQCFIDGITDKQEIGEKLGLNKAQIQSAFQNLYTRGDIVQVKGQRRRGRHGVTHYRLKPEKVVKPKPEKVQPPKSAWAGASSIFSMGA